MSEPTPHRRCFLTTAAGAVLGPSTLVIEGRRTTAADSVLAPNILRGEVLRTIGTLSVDEQRLTESPREIPVAGGSQVLVCGGGPAGIAAALAAARAGASVRLIELAGCLGGVWTAGLLTKILDSSNKSGIMAELLRLFAERGSNVARDTKGTVYDPEVAKLVHCRSTDATRRDSNRVEIRASGLGGRSVRGLHRRWRLGGSGGMSV